jgi:hypothetical protein
MCSQTVPSQALQLRLSGVTFRNNRADLAALMFTEAVDFAPLNCAPVACDTAVNNSAALSRQLIATPPTQIVVVMPVSVRSGAPLPISIVLYDGCGREHRGMACELAFSCPEAYPVRAALNSW